MTYPLNLFVADRCSLGDTKVGFWYKVAPPRDPLKMRIGMRTCGVVDKTKINGEVREIRTWSTGNRFRKMWERDGYKMMQTGWYHARADLYQVSVLSSVWLIYYLVVSNPCNLNNLEFTIRKTSVVNYLQFWLKLLSYIIKWFLTNAVLYCEERHDPVDEGFRFGVASGASKCISQNACRKHATVG